MKKRLFAVLLLAALCFALCLTAIAAVEETAESTVSDAVPIFFPLDEESYVSIWICLGISMLCMAFGLFCMLKRKK